MWLFARNVCVFAAATSLAEPVEGITFARPKSRIFACPRAVTKIFAGLMSRWTIPLACAASRASAISIASEQNRFDLHRPSRDAVLQRHAFQKLHGDERLARPARQYRGSCRYWDDSAPTRLGLHVESGPAPADHRPHHPVGTSAQRSDGDGCPQPCRRHPCRPHRASQRCDSERWFGRPQMSHPPNGGAMLRRWGVKVKVSKLSSAFLGKSKCTPLPL